MTTMGSTALTLADWAKRQDPDLKQTRIVEMLKQKNPILLDMPFLESNAPTHHRTTVRTSLPAAEWRRINLGVGKTKSTTAQIDEAVAMLETYAEVDKELADLNGNTGAFRLSEAQAFLEGMNQQMASTLFYGDKSTNPAAFDGFATRYASLDAENGKNIINAGGTGSELTSLWLIGWGSRPSTACTRKARAPACFTKIKVRSRSQIRMTPPVSTKATAITFSGRKTGLAVRDWRYGVRIANIDVTKLLDEKANGKFAHDLVRLVIAAAHTLPDRNAKFGLYLNRTRRVFILATGPAGSAKGRRLSPTLPRRWRCATARE